MAFKPTCGLGNRLCGLMNMFYLHQIYPEVDCYLIWIPNNHCDVHIGDLIDLSGPEYKWIRSGAEYDTHIFPKYRQSELWASTSSNQRTRWDDPDEWKKHPHIRSIAFHLYQFVSHEFCVKTFNSFKLQECVVKMIDLKRLSLPKSNPDLIHMRKGDLMKIIESIDQKVADNLLQQYAQLRHKYPDAMTVEYTQETVHRDRNHMIDSMSDLLVFARYCKLKVYCPYSWFSSWILILSEQYDPKYPVFNINYPMMYELP